ncbi:MAG: hypothetical protein M3Z31_19050, partial [Pseudomonadota bacterium]|nr:hypothetical protein [Pseudomonadota bacterium]
MSTSPITTPASRPLAVAMLAVGLIAVAAVPGFVAAQPAAAPSAAPVVPAPAIPPLLPEYSIGGGVETRMDTVNRSLFNPTRRPAPPVVTDNTPPKPQMQRGQFVLTGTTVVDGKATAFLREVRTGKSRRVAQGENINGLTVAEVKADHVKLAMGDESEDVSLKVIPNPRGTPGAAPPPATVVAGAQPAPGAAPGAPPGGQQAPQTPEQA